MGQVLAVGPGKQGELHNQRCWIVSSGNRLGAETIAAALAIHAGLWSASSLKGRGDEACHGQDRNTAGILRESGVAGRDHHRAGIGAVEEQ